jgi:hypothetical protein
MLLEKSVSSKVSGVDRRPSTNGIAERYASA